MSITKKTAGTVIAALAVCLSVGAIDAFAQTATPKPASKNATKTAKTTKAKPTPKAGTINARRLDSVPVKPSLKGLAPSVTHETTHTLTGVGTGQHNTTTDAGTVHSESGASNPSQPKLGTGAPR